MPSLLRHTYLLALIALATGCDLVYDDAPDGPAPGPVTRPRPEYITLRVDAPSSSRVGGSEAADPAAPGFEKGSELENYIDFAGGDYRLYLFSDEDDAAGEQSGGEFIAQLPSITSYTEGETTVNNVPTVTYTVTAMLPEAARERTQFRVVFLANWHTYPTADDLADRTLAYLTNLAASTFDALDSPADGGAWLSSDAPNDGSAKRLIPFYGVRSYADFGGKTNTEANEGGTLVTHTLDLSAEPLPLLRAMAKVELIVSPSLDATLTDVKVNHHNPLGYCAPAEAFDYTAYFKDYTYSWDDVFTSTPHIPAGMTDTGDLAFTRVSERSADGTTPEKWVAYMPEYVNIGSDTPAEIHLRVAGIDRTAKVYFARYPNGTIDNTGENRYNLLRNNIYRITITDLNINSANGTIVAVPWTYKSLPEIIL